MIAAISRSYNKYNGRDDIDNWLTSAVSILFLNKYMNGNPASTNENWFHKKGRRDINRKHRMKVITNFMRSLIVVLRI
jgi:hypothetical protein